MSPPPWSPILIPGTFPVNFARPLTEFLGNTVALYATINDELGLQEVGIVEGFAGEFSANIASLPDTKGTTVVLMGGREDWGEWGFSFDLRDSFSSQHLDEGNTLKVIFTHEAGIFRFLVFDSLFFGTNFIKYLMTEYIKWPKIR